MQAVILAGGRGKRLRPITDTVPKPLVPVLGRPIVEYTLGNLPVEIDEIIFVIGYKGEMIRCAFGEHSFGRPIRYAVCEELFGTGYAVRQAASLIHGKFLLLYGDDVYGPAGLARLVRHDWALLVWRVGHPETKRVVVTDEDGCVVRLVEKPQKFISDLTWTGAGVFQPEPLLSVDTTPYRREQDEYEEVPDMFCALIDRGVKFRTELADLWLRGNTHEQHEAAAAELRRRAGT
jgi:bifunctional UDP-N-acetylglucosamine pyrophosphorylase/glucosamine-1-phosphate N-acetyltransferase